MSNNSAKVLIVDDLATNIELLQVYLEEEGYNILTATNGKEAWETTKKELPDIILLDVMMPIMDGYEACRLIKNDPQTESIPVVMVTSLNEVSSRIAGIEAGADDFLSKPFNIYELLARVRSLIRIKQFNFQILDQNRVFEKELAIAKKVQEAILPDESDIQYDGLSLSFNYNPSLKLGGDYFNVVRFPDNRIGIFMADVMGHGIAASLITMVLKTLFDTHSNNFKSPNDFLFKLNNELEKIFGDILIYATAIYIIVDVKERKMIYSNAAHPSAFLFKPSGDSLEELQCKGTVLGIFKDAEYELIERALEPEEKVFIFTDGLTDLENPQNEGFGEDRLKEFINKNRDQDTKIFVKNLVEVINNFAEGQNFEDDVNIICFNLT